MGLILPSFGGWSWERRTAGGRDGGLGVPGWQWVKMEQAHMGWVRSNNSSATGQRPFVRERKRPKTTDKKNRAKNRE